MVAAAAAELDGLKDLEDIDIDKDDTVERCGTDSCDERSSCDSE